MGAQDVLDVLEFSKKPLTSTEISELCNIGLASVKRLLNALNRDVSVNLKFKNLSSKEKKERYGKNLNCPFIRVYWLKK